MVEKNYVKFGFAVLDLRKLTANASLIVQRVASTANVSSRASASAVLATRNSITIAAYRNVTTARMVFVVRRATAFVIEAMRETPPVSVRPSVHQLAETVIVFHRANAFVCRATSLIMQVTVSRSATIVRMATVSLPINASAKLATKKMQLVSASQSARMVAFMEYVVLQMFANAREVTKNLAIKHVNLFAWMNVLMDFALRRIVVNALWAIQKYPLVFVNRFA